MLRRARRFCSYSAVTCQGKRFQGVRMVLSQMRSAYSNPETKARVWPVPVPRMKVALVRALAFKTRTAGVRGGGSGVPTGGVNGFWMQPVAVALAQGKKGAAACAIGSAPFQFKPIADGVEVQLFAGCRLNKASAPL